MIGVKRAMSSTKAHRVYAACLVLLLAEGESRKPISSVSSKFYGQATKGAWWMPWQKQAMKDVASCDKPRGAASRH